MTHDEMIAVIQAHKDGKKIRRRPRVIDIWSDYAGGGFDFVSFEYEIKPEPMEIWVNVYNAGIGNVYSSAESAGEARESAKSCGKHGRTVKFREVLDE